MTGKRLYELLCDEWGKRSYWDRKHLPDGKDWCLADDHLPAWAFLRPYEKRTFNAVAERITRTRR